MQYKKQSVALGLAVLVLCATALEGLCQPRGSFRERRASAIAFDLDVASFPDGQGGAYTELYLSVPLTSLHFSETGGDRPTTRVAVTAIFYDEDESQITGDDWTYHNLPGSTLRKENEGKFLNRTYRFQLPPGKASARVRVEEPDRGLVGLKVARFEVPNFQKRAFNISTLVFGICSDRVQTAPSSSYSGDLLPHPSRRYGEENPELCSWFRIEDQGEAGGVNEYTLRYKIKNRDGKTLKDSTFTAMRTDRVTDVSLSTNLSGLVLGRYSLEVEASLGKQKAKRLGYFRVDESRISFIEDTQKTRTVLGYIASREDLRAIEDAPDDSLAVFWKEFWLKRDPTPETQHNESLLEFLKRVDYATQNFGVLEPGWRSDRGRIYIKYGEPDEIERYPENRFSTEVWHYYSRNAAYVFQDIDGFGRYRLVGPQRD